MPTHNQSALISVVIPVRNREQLISSALDSVAAQSYRPLEVVVVDDGSTDSTRQVVDEWASDHQSSDLSVMLVAQNGRGANAARNRGIEEATGDYVAFLDSDDIWLQNKLLLQMDVFQRDPVVGGCYCGLRQVNLETGETHDESQRKYPVGDILAAMLIQDVTSPTSCWVVRKSCFAEAGLFDVSMEARQDWDMWIRLSENFSIGCVPKALVEMGNHPGDRVRSDPFREIRAHRAIYDKYARLRNQKPLWVSLAARSAMYRRRGRVYFHRDISVLRAVGMQLMAIVVWPLAFDSYAALAGILLPRRQRQKLRYLWNRIFGRTSLAIKTH